MKEYKAILIGNGTMGARHKARFEGNGVRFTKILDLDAPQWIAAESASLASADLMKNRPDFAVVASPASTHYEYAKFFLERRIPVLVEKPLAVSAAQANELVELSEKADTLLFVAQSECFNPIFLNFRKHFLVELANCSNAKDVRLEFRREHGYTERCRDVDVSLDILVHDLSMFLTLFHCKDVRVVSSNKTDDRAVMTLKVSDGPYAGLTADFIADRNSPNDVRTISVDFGGRGNYVISLARYMSDGNVAHIPDSLDNEHKFFLKLLAGACMEWGVRSARIAAQVVELATRR